MKARATTFEGNFSDLVGSVDVIAGKWKVKIICHLFGGTKRFSELRRLLPGVLGVISRDVDQVGNSTEECHQCPAFAHSRAE